MRVLILLSVAASASAQTFQWTPESVSALEGVVGADGAAEVVRLDLEAGELVELALDYPGPLLSLRIVNVDDGVVERASAARAQRVRESFVAPESGVYALYANVQAGGGAYSGTLSSFGVGEGDETASALCPGLACVGRHDVGFAVGEWERQERWEVYVEVAADEPVDLEVVRVEGDTLRASGLEAGVGPFYYSDEIELKDGPFRVAVRRRDGTPGAVGYTLRVRRWAYALEDEDVPLPLPGRRGGDSPPP